MAHSWEIVWFWHFLVNSKLSPPKCIVFQGDAESFSQKKYRERKGSWNRAVQLLWFWNEGLLQG